MPQLKSNKKNEQKFNHTILSIPHLSSISSKDYIWNNLVYMENKDWEQYYHSYRIIIE